MKEPEEVTGRRRKSEMAVNMTPLIDCVFLLLIFFMIATTFAPMPGIRVKLPPPGAPPPGSDKPEQLILRISNPEGGGVGVGTMILNDQVVSSMQTLLDTFRKSTLKQKEMLIIQSGRQVMHEQIVSIMDMAKRADVKKIGFAMVAR